MSFLLIFVTGTCRSTFMKRHFGRIGQIWNFKMKLYLKKKIQVLLKNTLNKFMLSNLESHALDKNTIYKQY